MNREYTREDLLLSLPDFIEGKLDDSNLIELIQNEIDVNPEFRNEYELMQMTIGSFRKFEIQEPPANYFSNLLPAINEKIYAKENKSKFADYIRLFLKIALPAAAVLLIYLGYNSFFKDRDGTYISKTDTPNVYKNDFSANQKSEEFNGQKFTDNTEEELDDIYDYENLLSFFYDQEISRQTTKLNSKSPDKIQIDLSDNVPDEIIFFSDDDDNSFEQIFENLDKKEQNDLLEKIKTSKL